MAKSLLHTAAFILDAIATVFAVMAIVLVCFEAMTRYFAPQYAVDWGTEVTVYLLVWSTMMLSGRAAYEGRHVSATIIVDLLPARIQSIFGLVALVAGISFGLVLLLYGWKVVEFANRLNVVSDSTLQFPKAYYYLVLPFMGAMLIINCSLRAAKLILQGRNPIEPVPGMKS